MKNHHQKKKNHRRILKITTSNIVYDQLIGSPTPFINSDYQNENKNHNIEI